MINIIKYTLCVLYVLNYVQCTYYVYYSYFIIKALITSLNIEIYRNYLKENS